MKGSQTDLDDGKLDHLAGTLLLNSILSLANLSPPQSTSRLCLFFFFLFFWSFAPSTRFGALRHFLTLPFFSPYPFRPILTGKSAPASLLVRFQQHSAFHNLANSGRRFFSFSDKAQERHIASRESEVDHRQRPFSSTGSETQERISNSPSTTMSVKQDQINDSVQKW